MPATQPTKEQVRAYLHDRVHNRASDRLPPPTPEEIRQLLGWHHRAAQAQQILHPSGAMPALLWPGTMYRLATLLAVEWCVMAVGLNRRGQHGALTLPGPASIIPGKHGK